MSIRIAREVHCDNCGEWTRSYYGRVEDVWRELKKEGWTRSKEEHYCKSCSEKRKQAYGKEAV